MSSKESLLILALSAVLFCSGAAVGSGAERTGTHTREIRLLFTGDILLSRNVETRLKRGEEELVNGLRPLLAGADWAAGNLEGAVGFPSDCRDSVVPSPPCFPVRQDRVGLLRRLGFSGIGMENNHSLDLGPEGKRATRSALVQNGLLPLTLEDSPRFLRFGDVTVGLVCFSMVSGPSGGPGQPDFTELRQKFRLARSLANIVVAYVHWGSEFLDWPDEKQRRTARWVVKNGADIVVGHHPHIVQKPEILDGKPVFYSLGNLLFDQKYPSTKEGSIADCRIADGAVRCTSLMTRTPADSTYPAVTGEAAELPGGGTFEMRPPLTINGIELRPLKSEPTDSAPGVVLEARRENKVLWKSPRARILSLEKMNADGDRKQEFLFTLETHYSPLDKEFAVRPCVYDVRPEGLVSKWRGTALAFPLKDAVCLSEEKVLCALHRGDSFLTPDPESRKTRIVAYRWNGFGFSGIQDSEVIGRCGDCFE